MQGVVGPSSFLRMVGPDKRYMMFMLVALSL